MGAPTTVLGPNTTNFTSILPHQLTRQSNNDSSHAIASMLDIEVFDTVFPTGAGYNNALVTQIESHKKMLGGKTFFERLLELLQIKCMCRTS